MSKRKKYDYFLCKDCDTDFFLSAQKSKRICCPLCGDGIHVELVRSLWAERPFTYKKPWTPEEDDMISDGKRLKHTNKSIAASLNGRTEKAVNNRWYTLQKRKREAIQ